LNEAPFAFGVVILAAGASTRMGTCKLLLPWGEKTILTHLLDQWRSAELHKLLLSLIRQTSPYERLWHMQGSPLRLDRKPIATAGDV
jgi:CTP:molybdopterin cytidylyltransferase MocA